MISLQLTEQEADALVRSLEFSLSEMRMEIAETDRKDFREAIKCDKACLEHVVEQIKAEVPV